MPASEAQLSLCIVGPLRLIDAAGQEFTPKGRKSRGLLAILARSPNLERSRALLQDKLWSDRGATQGADSLRQTLSEIRRHLGPHRSALRADRSMVGLDKSMVKVVDRPTAEQAGRECQLLEGLDALDPEFENWLRDERMKFESETMPERADVAPPAASPRARREPPEPGRFVLLLRSGSPPRNANDAIMSASLTDIVAKSLSELHSFEIADLRGAGDAAAHASAVAGADAFTIEADFQRGDAGSIWRASVSDMADRRVLWNTIFQDESVNPADLRNPKLLGASNQVVDAVMASVLSMRPERQGKLLAAVLCQKGSQLLLKLGRENVEEADRLFARAYDLNPRGLYLAWRAYLRTYTFVERYTTNPEATIAEAIDFMRRALELEPQNSYVLSFSAHVHGAIRRSYVASYELAQRSIELNRANPLGWACLGIAECNLGKAKAGFHHTLIAREIAGTSPFRYQIDGLACIAGSVAGDLSQAIWMGEASRALAPDFKPPLRFLSVLYLLNGRREEADAIVRELQRLEPGFSYESLRDSAYPAASLQRARLLSVLPRREI